MDAVGRAALAALVEPLETPLRQEALPGWLLEHQSDAVVRSRAILARFGGVLLADGVGLGKTYIALALAALERASGGEALAVIPAALRDEWHRAGQVTGVVVPTVTHTELAQRVPQPPVRCSLLLVDEAHAFRNPRTRRYDALARLAIGRRVALLTATPLNNGVADLAALIHLFAPHDRFREFGVADMAEGLRRGAREPALALGAVAVCRTRRIVEERFPELARSFPRRVLLPPARYDLARVYGGQQEQLTDAIRPPGGSGPSERGAALMLLSMLRRMESSAHALRRTLLRHRAFLEEWERAARAGVALSRQSFHAAVPRGDADDTQLVMWPMLDQAAGGVGGSARWRAAIDRALVLLEGNLPAVDPKLVALDGLLDGALRGRKVIVFTEYRDTALHLLRHLRRTRRVIAVLGDGAWAGVTRLSRRHAFDAFAPLARGARPDPLLQADVLVATDVASEGMNLQDAAAVVNYDLPWNPVRVMQRVGRADRLDSPHDDVQVAHVVPGGGLDSLCRVLETLRDKLDNLSFPGAEPDPLAALWWLDGRSLDPALVEQESWRRVAPFEARERWRMTIGPCGRATGPAVVAAGLAQGDHAPRAGVLLALEWPDGRRVPLPYVAEAGHPVRCDAHEFGHLAERALSAEPVPAQPADFNQLLAAALPDARRRLVECSAARHSATAGPGRRLALDLLREHAGRLHRARSSLTHITRATEALAGELPVGLDRLIGRIASQSRNTDELARRISELVHGAPAPPVPELRGLPRLVLLAAIALASDGGRWERGEA